MDVFQKITLTEREVAFVRFVCEGYSAKRAAIEAGYAGATAPHLMRMPRIIAAIQACGDNARAALQKVAERKPRRAVSRDTSESIAA